MGDLQPGTQVTPTVRLVRRIGEGGMGSVWLADHLSLHTQVVVKFMSHELAGNDEGKARFSREAAAAAQVKSPHVVHMLDHGVSEADIPYILMELLEGEDLGRRLAREGTLPPTVVVAVVSQVAKALAKAHAAGILHRDIKPDNIFLCEQGDQDSGDIFIKLLDFGIAKTGPSLDGSTRAGQVLGTPYYMSPEQILGQPVDARSDLYSLAVVAFEALTGERPFRGDTIGALTLAMHSGPLPLPTQIAPQLPEAVDTWFAKACAKDPNDRFQLAKDLANGLRVAFGERAPMSSRIDPAELAGPESSVNTALAVKIEGAIPSSGGGAKPPSRANVVSAVTGLSAGSGPLGSSAADVRDGSTDDAAIVDIPFTSQRPKLAGLAALALLLAVVGFLGIRAVTKSSPEGASPVASAAPDAEAPRAAGSALAGVPAVAAAPAIPSPQETHAPPSPTSPVAPVASVRAAPADRAASPRPGTRTTSRPSKPPRRSNDDDIK